jgi:hypothetical protein
MDEGEGAVIYDETSNHNDGTIYGATWTTAGKVNSALDFDGVDDYVDCGNGASLNITDAITIEAWVKQTSANSYAAIVTKGQGPDYGYLYQFNAETRKPVLYLMGAHQSWDSADTAIPLDVWSFISVTYDGTYIRYFLNGNPDGIVTASPGGGITPNTVNLSIGSRAGNGDYFNGTIDEVRVLRKALSADEIYRCYQKSGPGVAASWLMDKGEGSVIYDETSNYNDGTIYGATWTTAGKVNSALEFDGADDYVDCGNDASLDITEAITIEAWINAESYPATGEDFIVAKSSAYYLCLTPGGKLAVYTYGTSPQAWFESVADITLDEWTHIAVTYDQTNIIIYINGSSDNSAGRTGTISTSAHELGIGDAIVSGSPYGKYFNGTIDGVRIYSLGLSAEEVDERYQRGL